MRKYIFRTFLLLFIFFVFSCSKKQEDIVVSEVSQNTKFNNSNATLEENQPKNAEVNVSIIENTLYHYIEYDDIINEARGSTEYNLQKGDQNFCIAHSILKISNFDHLEHSVVDSWSSPQGQKSWYEQEKDDFSVIWTYPYGLVVRLTTTSPEWQTKRGIHVGSTRKEVIQAYKKDSDFYEFNTEHEEFDLVQDKDNELFEIYSSYKGFSINTPDYEAEEMMTMLIYITDEMVSKIEIKIGN